MPIPDPEFKGNDELPEVVQLGSLETEATGALRRCLYASECKGKINFERTDTADVLCCNLENVPASPVYAKTNNGGKMYE
ncbi:MAG: hypothetical protein ACLRSW_03540 [Christensenellaceae bacterium]